MLPEFRGQSEPEWHNVLDRRRDARSGHHEHCKLPEHNKLLESVLVPIDRGNARYKQSTARRTEHLFLYGNTVGASDMRLWVHVERRDFYDNPKIGCLQVSGQLDFALNYLC